MRWPQASLPAWQLHTLPAAPSPPCQAALMPLASSCQQMFVCGVAGRQLNRACVFLAPGPPREPSLCGLCKPSKSTPRKPQHGGAQALAQLLEKGSLWPDPLRGTGKWSQTFLMLPAPGGTDPLDPFSATSRETTIHFTKCFVKTEATAPVPSEVTCGPCPWEAGQ